MPSQEQLPRLFRGKKVGITPEEQVELQNGISRLLDHTGFGDTVPYSLEEINQLLSQRIPLGERNIIGFGYGLPEKRGRPIKELAVVMYVVRKVPEELVEPGCLGKELISRVFPDAENLRPDVVEMGIVEA